MQSDAASRGRNSDSVGGPGGLDGEDHAGGPGGGVRRRGNHSRRLMAWEVATKAAARPTEATSMAGEIGELSKMNGARPDPYVILNLGSFLRRVPFQRLAVWTAVAITMYQLRDFVGVRVLPKFRASSANNQYTRKLLSCRCSLPI